MLCTGSLAAIVLHITFLQLGRKDKKNVAKNIQQHDLVVLNGKVTLDFNEKQKAKHKRYNLGMGWGAIIPFE